MVPLMIFITTVLSGYGALIIIVLKRSLQQNSEGRRGFLRKTGMMILTVAGFVAQCVFLGLSGFEDITAVQVRYFLFLSSISSKFSISFVGHG